MVGPKPVSLTQVDAGDYDGPFDPQPLVVVGPIPGGGGGGGAVDSVNGKTGTVVLNANDVGAATTAQGAKADTAVQPTGIANLVPGTRTVAGKPLSADVTLVKADVGLGNVDNTSDANKPVSTATQTALNGKVSGLNGVTGLWKGTQAAYDGLTPDPNVIYVIQG